MAQFKSKSNSVKKDDGRHKSDRKEKSDLYSALTNRCLRFIYRLLIVL